MERIGTLALRIPAILRIAGLVAAAMLVGLFTGQILLSPSHPVGLDDPEEISDYYKITFPIPELGNCANFYECRAFCEDPVNHTTCIDYAKSKGFHQEEPLATKIEVILSTAKSVLGCDSIASCQSFCEIPANFDKCNSFAQRQGLVGGYIHDPLKDQVLVKAKEVLGCESAESCVAFCEQEANRDRCSEFARNVGLRGGEHQVGPGGCTSEATCKTFCSDPNNYQICSGFAGSSGGTFTGPGGCNSPESCRAYCEKNPAECGYGGPGASPPPGYNPQEMCNKTPNCSWTGNTCQCGLYGETQESQNRVREYADFCKNNPDKCKVGPGGYPIPEDKASQIGTPPGGYEDYQDYCKRYPIECQIYQQGAPRGGYLPEDPATQCARYGCTWTGSTCQCAGQTSGQYQPPPAPGTPPPTAGYTPPPEGGFPAPGTYTPPPSYTPPPESGTYTQPSYTSPPTYESQPPPSYESQPPPSYESQPPPSTYGAATQRGLLQLILEYFLNLF